MVNFVQSFLEETVALINECNKELFIFLLLAVNFLYFGLTDNEEQTLQLAKQYFSPEWIPDSINLTEFPGTRLFYQYINGFLLDYLTFEQLALAGRFFFCILFAFPLAKIFKWLSISNISFLFLFQIIYFSNQAYFAGEWIFLSYETKQFAYFFLFYSLYYLFTEKYYRSILFIAIATYFHILVGGWFFLLSCLYVLVKHKSLLKSIKLSTLYLIIVAPFVYYLANEILLQTQTVTDGVNLDWVFCYFRAPHHVGIFKSLGFFISTHAKGVLLTTILFFICLFLFSDIEEEKIQKLNRLNIVIFLFTFLFIIIAWFDENGFLLKFFPFRVNTLTAFLIPVQFFYIFKNYIIKEEYIKSLDIIFLLLCIPFLLKPMAKNAQTFVDISKEPLVDDLTEYIRGHSKRNAVFLFYEKEQDAKAYNLLSFNRKARRDRFVIYKFTPYGGDKVYDWYKRVLAKQALLKDLDYLPELKKQFPVDYIISKKPLKSKKIKRVFKNKKYYLYEIRK